MTLLSFFRKSKTNWYRNDSRKIEELEEFLKSAGWINQTLQFTTLRKWTPPAPLTEVDNHCNIIGVAVDPGEQRAFIIWDI